MIPVRGYEGHRVGVLGLGRSGRATAAALIAGGAEAICWDDDAGARDKAAAEGFEIADLSRDAAWSGIGNLIVSPGIPHLYPAPHPIVIKALEKGAVLDNDIGLFFRSFGRPEWDNMEAPPRVICVTGSNGKSTTTALIHHVLQAAGKPVQMAGNIGRGALDLEPGRDGEIVVLELSSYQIELARALAPDMAIFLNLSPDHLDRHGGLGGYFAAKRRLFTEGGPEKAIIGVDEVEGRFLAQAMSEGAGEGDPVISISAGRKLTGTGWNIFARKGFLAEWRKGRQVSSIDLRGLANLPGAHNHQNACAAYGACRTLGLAPKVVEEGLKTYPGLAHRCQLIATHAGVNYVNDSKATNADAAEKSLLAFENIRWIAGGEPKAGGIAPLVPHFGRLKKAYLIGQAAANFAATLGEVPHVIAGTMAAAVAQAHADAEPGDTVLLAPACASFDQYANFEARGEDFVACVKAGIKD